MQIATNATAISISNEMRVNQLEVSGRMASLSSGKRIQSASDDSANMQISNRLTTLGKGMNVAIRNANDGISITQTAEGAAQEVTNILQRMRDLAIQSANASNSKADRRALQEETGQLKKELSRIAQTTTFGGQYLLDGSFGRQSFQVGAESNQTIEVALTSLQQQDLKHNQLALDGRAISTTYTGTSLNGARALIKSDGFGSGAAGPGVDKLTIVGSNSSVVGLSSSGSAAQMAADINAVFQQTGVKATASTSLALHIHSGVDTARVGFESGEKVSFELGNGKELATISFTATGDYVEDMAKLQSKINENVVSTGISADFDSSRLQLTLTSTVGDNIEIANYSESSEAVDNQLALRAISHDGRFESASSLTNNGSAAIVRGQVTLTSLESFSLTSDANFGVANNALGSANSLLLAKEDSVEDIDLTTQEGAQQAISIIDSALAKVDSLRANLGASHNRFSSTVANLAVTQQNNADTTSRILDTDYSKQTAELAKLQVTQQAATALMSQANSMQDQAIRLLG